MIDLNPFWQWSSSKTYKDNSAYAKLVKLLWSVCELLNLF